MKFEYSNQKTYFVIHFFWPVTKKCLPSAERTAFVLIFATSEPALCSKISKTNHGCRGEICYPGSVIAMQIRLIPLTISGTKRS